MWKDEVVYNDETMANLKLYRAQPMNLLAIVVHHCQYKCSKDGRLEMASCSGMAVCSRVAGVVQGGGSHALPGRGSLYKKGT